MPNIKRKGVEETVEHRKTLILYHFFLSKRRSTLSIKDRERVLPPKERVAE